MRTANQSVWVGEKDGREWRVECVDLRFPLFGENGGEAGMTGDLVKRNTLHDPTSISSYEILKVSDGGRVAWDRHGQRYTLKPLLHGT